MLPSTGTTALMNGASLERSSRLSSTSTLRAQPHNSVDHWARWVVHVGFDGSACHPASARLRLATPGIAEEAEPVAVHDARYSLEVVASVAEHRGYALQVGDGVEIA